VRGNWLGRVAVAGGATVVIGLAIASPARAVETIGINPGNVPTTASAFEQGCDFGDGPYADKDVWVFVLPGNTADFVSVTATFGPNGKLTIPADGGAIVDDKGTSKAWITTPAGWTLTAATAVITGTDTQFNLTHTCAASGSSTPTPGTGTPGPTASATPGPTASGTATPGPGATPSAGTGGSGGLPVTGSAVTGMVLTGGALVAGGVALLTLRRRRNAFTTD
jgi:LPXTG-motif cell wall-anchored protein